MLTTTNMIFNLSMGRIVLVENLNVTFEIINSKNCSIDRGFSFLEFFFVFILLFSLFYCLITVILPIFKKNIKNFLFKEQIKLLNIQPESDENE